MLDWPAIVANVIAALTAGGWLMSRHNRKKDNERHSAEVAQLRADLDRTIKQTETSYVQDALKIYSENVVEPIRNEIKRNNDRLIRLETAINMAPTCRIYPDCVIIHRLQDDQADDRK